MSRPVISPEASIIADPLRVRSWRKAQGLARSVDGTLHAANVNGGTCDGCGVLLEVLACFCTVPRVSHLLGLGEQQAGG
jgi:hypothetical protein